MSTIPHPVARRAQLPRPALPLTEKQFLTYKEVQALGICPERTLRRLVGARVVVRAVHWTGSRIKFERAVLLEELRHPQK